MQWYVITEIGIGPQTDALFAGMVFPQVVLAVVSNSLTHVLVPLLVTEDECSFHRDAWGFFIGVTALFGMIAIVLALSASYWVAWFFPGFSNEGRELTVVLAKIQLISMVFTASVSVLWSVYHARRKFIWVESSAVMSNLITLLFLVWALPLFGIEAAAWGTVLRTGLLVAWLSPGLGQMQRPDWNSPAIAAAWGRLKPLLLGTVYYKTDPLIDRFLSSLAPAGGLSLLYLGQQIYGAGNQIIDKSIAAPLVPVLALQAKMSEKNLFQRTYRKRLLYVAGLTGILYVAFIFTGNVFLELLIGHGGVTEQNVMQLWTLMLCLGGVFIGGAMGQITSLSFYAKGDTRTPTRLGIWTYTIYVPAKVLAFALYGLNGLAISTSIFNVLNVVLQLSILDDWNLLGKRAVYENK